MLGPFMVPEPVIIPVVADPVFFHLGFDTSIDIIIVFRTAVAGVPSIIVVRPHSVNIPVVSKVVFWACSGDTLGRLPLDIK